MVVVVVAGAVVVVVVPPGQTQPGWHWSIAPPGDGGGQLRLPGGSHCSPGSRIALPHEVGIVLVVVVLTTVVVVVPGEGQVPIRGAQFRKRKSLSVFGFPLVVTRASIFIRPVMSLWP